MRAKGWWFDIGARSDEDGNWWVVSVYRLDLDATFADDDDSLPLAICKASLAALKAIDASAAHPLTGDRNANHE